MSKLLIVALSKLWGRIIKASCQINYIFGTCHLIMQEVRRLTESSRCFTAINDRLRPVSGRRSQDHQGPFGQLSINASTPDWAEIDKYASYLTKIGSWIRNVIDMSG